MLLIRNIRRDQSLPGKGLGGTTVRYFFKSRKSFKKIKKQGKKKKRVLILFFYCWYHFESRRNAMENVNISRIQKVEYGLRKAGVTLLCNSEFNCLELCPKLLMQVINKLESWVKGNVIAREVSAFRKAGREISLFGEQFTFYRAPAQLALL